MFFFLKHLLFIIFFLRKKTHYLAVRDAGVLEKSE